MWTDPRDGKVVVQTQFTLLHVAAQEDCAAAVDALLRLGADVGAEGEQKYPQLDKVVGVSPLHVAARGGGLAAVSVLLGLGGCNVNARRQVGVLVNCVSGI